MNKKLRSIKLIHTIIWLLYVIVIFYILYAGIADRLDMLSMIAIGSVILEIIILIIYKWKCPLTLWGYKYTDNHEVGFDIYLPKWLAKHNKAIFGTIFTIALLIVIYRLFT